MGSTMKPTIFNERVAAALRNWHHAAKKHIKLNKVSMTPMSSRPTTPSHPSTHPFRSYRSEAESFQNSPRKSNFDSDRWNAGSPSPSHHHQIELGHVEHDKDVQVISAEPSSTKLAKQHAHGQHEIGIGSKDFSFGIMPQVD